jgi:hypothetical protein
MLSLGFSYAQLDLGFKPHRSSPFSDSSMLMSEAPTMPSVSLSNWKPISSFGIQYELSIARISTYGHIFIDGKDVRGSPRLTNPNLTVAQHSAISRPRSPARWDDELRTRGRQLLRR